MTTPYKWQGLEEDPRQQKASPVKQNVMATLVKCVPTSVQPGFKRFPNPHDRPHIKQWRCELTALSHRYNLYFVACNDTIHVYQPGFPNQRLSDEPDLILYPPVSPGDLDHGIDPYDPHSINRLLVDYLGREEIVLVVCDDGDVIGYRVDEIHRAIENRVISGNGEQEPIEGDSVRVFLHRNVGESAWGLAVHREARMIAISANTHEITVLAYALASPDPETEESDPSDCLRNEHDVEDFPVPRRRDHVFVLPAMANIPAVSFINNGTDPAGRWLSSNSIDGKTIVWDLHHPLRPGREIEVGCCVNVQDPTKTPGSCNCQHRAHVLHAAWNTIFLDPRSAHPSADIREAFGLASQDDEDLLKKPPCFRDITSSRERFKVRSNGMPFQIHHALNPIGQGDAPIEDESSDISLSDTGEEGDQEEEEQADEEDDDEQEEDEEETESIIVSGESPHSGSDNMSLDEQPEEESEANIPTAENQPELIVETANQHIVTLDQAALQVFEEESDDSDDESFGVLPPSGHSQMDYVMGTRRPRFYYHVKDPHNLQESVPSPPTPCLIVTKDELYLLQRPLGHPPWMKETIITMRKPLHPGELDFRPSLLPLPHQSFDRQCFSSQISELGVFIIATPAGRVGIFSFTQVKSSQTLTSTFGFRLEYLLPFSKSDEHIIEGLPPMRLVGVAVGPVQGMLDELYQGDSESGSKPGEWDLRSRRWRLIMYFNDNTVLSYELSKRRECDSLSVGDLVV